MPTTTGCLSMFIVLQGFFFFIDGNANQSSTCTHTLGRPNNHAVYNTPAGCPAPSGERALSHMAQSHSVAGMRAVRLTSAAHTTEAQ